MGKDYITIDKAFKRATCIVCLSDIDIKELLFGKQGNNRCGICLCKSCRNLLHKRLHEEE